MRDPDDAPGARVAANHLRELDRLLNLLADAAMAHMTGWSPADAAAFARLRNTPNKLAALAQVSGVPDANQIRLRATGRLANRLNHRRTLAGAPDASCDMVIAVGASSNQFCDMSQMSTRAIAAIASFYAQVADQILGDVQEISSPR